MSSLLFSSLRTHFIDAVEIMHVGCDRLLQSRQRTQASKVRMYAHKPVGWLGTRSTVIVSSTAAAAVAVAVVVVAAATAATAAAVEARRHLSPCSNQEARLPRFSLCVLVFMLVCVLVCLRAKVCVRWVGGLLCSACRWLRGVPPVPLEVNVTARYAEFSAEKVLAARWLAVSPLSPQWKPLPRVREATGARP